MNAEQTARLNFESAFLTPRKLTTNNNLASVDGSGSGGHNVQPAEDEPERAPQGC